MQNNLKALVFDLDGTLYVSVPLGREILLSACRYIAQLKGITVEEAGQALCQVRERLSSVSGTATSLSRACEELGGSLQELHAHFAADIRPEHFLVRDERLVELLKKLATRFELHLYTNNNRTLTAAITEQLGVAGLFGEVVTIEDSWLPKPDRHALESVLQRIGKTADECLFIGDRYDIDLRLPAELGSGVFLVSSMEELFPLVKLIDEESV